MNLVGQQGTLQTFQVMTHQKNKVNKNQNRSARIYKNKDHDRTRRGKYKSKE